MEKLYLVSGAPLPNRADAVVRLEEAEIDTIIMSHTNKITEAILS